jgi:hypothetical protein
MTTPDRNRRLGSRTGSWPAAYIPARGTVTFAASALGCPAISVDEAAPACNLSFAEAANRLDLTETETEFKELVT